MRNQDIKNIKVISVDAADTLFHIKNGLGEAYAETAKKYGFTANPREIKRAFSRAFESAPPLAFGRMDKEKRKESEKKWWYDVVRDVYNEIGMFDGFDDYFEDLFDKFSNRAWAAFPDSEPALFELKRMGYEIMLISNFDSRVYGVLDKLNLKKFFSSFTISSEAGFSKPSREIFEIALEKQGAEPHECLHIGDDMEKDYAGARNAGMCSVLLSRKSPPGNGVSCVESLTEIPALLAAGRKARQ